jgi:hypothetical protein
MPPMSTMNMAAPNTCPARYGVICSDVQHQEQQQQHRQGSTAASAQSAVPLVKLDNSMLAH